ARWADRELATVGREGLNMFCRQRPGCAPGESWTTSRQPPSRRRRAAPAPWVGTRPCSRPARTPVQVDIVELGELALVEAADEQERVALDEQGRAGCAADSPGPIELADVVLAEADVIGCAQG